MIRVITFLALVIWLTGCANVFRTSLVVEIPNKEDVDAPPTKINYSYPMWQEKYFTWEIAQDGSLNVNFQSKSDPLVKAMETVESLSNTINNMNPKAMP